MINLEYPTFTDDLKCELKWLHDNSQDEIKISGIKQQKFLLFYNLFLFVENENYNFNSLKAWKNGPVYAQVHSIVKYHYTYQELFSTIEKEISIDKKLAEISKFIVNLVSDEEISNVTHEFDFWKNVVNQENNSITEKDISNNDETKIKKILTLYNLDFILTHKIYTTENTKFIIEKEKYDCIIKNYKKELDKIISDKLVVVSLSENGLKIEEKKTLQEEINS